jgi:hypothetical protein
MKYINAVAATAIVAALNGCATSSKVVVADRLGPCHEVASETRDNGSLQVYSARTLAAGVPSSGMDYWNNDYGQNELLYGIAHTDYSIRRLDGTLLQRVRNSRGLNDADPAVVRLPAGFYTVEAEAEDYPGVNMTVVIPVAIKPGQTTTAHLEPNWQRSGETMDSAGLVRLADGRVLGCRFGENLLSQNLR